MSGTDIQIACTACGATNRLPPGREIGRQSGAMDAASIAGWARAQLRG
ncbi:hypothetical protein [Paracoccus denitrificans]|jgi:hypothetical protein|nr:hypothetical protein [Paracoccus denitrificans]MBB4629436.1 hypothetical protein [Paracoccus denitrificans]MCU7430899.1 hypothetical protein [Paracoccus denitrificans]UPV94111.1 hypothetical protein M0K93_09510 [Paracoccus denitrificans]WQO33850.1 hypothetical protein U0005_01935 [Paracoccus denitrificans]SDJ53425.1 hypothetical protein SAMN04244581_04188 [Paracoccus denitrificans]